MGTMSIFYKYMYIPPPKDLSKLVSDLLTEVELVRSSLSISGLPNRQLPSIDAFKRRYNKCLSVIK